ncbi:O-antigen ligase [Mycobacterium sp. CPCC 205372]|uniref:O-antigen ligase n=1 Tax=Mycobacterium hippophais TaxID=3016340 RepID=A0ABT4PRW7_9MYCO|nr:O-antigen polymerase [Mycobacterium hippophais]MCZ8379295.1 O-antigen ligase [Mycobacterium hippophais]
MTSLAERRTAAVGEASFDEPRARWLSPVFLTLCIASAAIIPTALLDDQQFRSMWRTPKSVTIETLLLFGCGAMALAFGALAAITLAPASRPLDAPWPALGERSVSALRRCSSVLAALTLIGYAGFAVMIARSGITIPQLLSGDPSVKTAIGTIPGVTTLTQFGVAAMVAASLLLAQRFSRFELAKLLIIVGLAVVRAFVNSERLAVMELVVPIVVVFAAKLAAAPGVRRRLAQLIPAVFLVLVVVLFGVFEFFRSWGFYRAHTSDSFIEFTLNRIAGYYATAMNNGHLNIEHLQWPKRLPYDTVEAVWSAPGVEAMRLYERLGGHPPPNTRDPADSLYVSVLSKFGNPEFNSESGYSGPFVDYGSVGGIIFFLVVGLAAGLIYRGFCQGAVFGLVLYPVFFIGLLELPRYMYWSYGRAMYAWIGLAAIVFLLSRTKSKESHET